MGLVSTEQDKAVVFALEDTIAEAVGETHYAELALTRKVLDAIADSQWLDDLLAERDKARASVAAVRELVEHRSERYAEHGGIRAVPVADLRRALGLDPVAEGCNNLLAAVWCAEHGDCACPDQVPGDDVNCPLHSPTSEHAEDQTSPSATHSLTPKPERGGGGHTPGVGWMCTGCGWRFSYDVPEARAREVWAKDERHLMEQGRRLASRRDDLIAQGADPSELEVPLAPGQEPAAMILPAIDCPNCAEHNAVTEVEANVREVEAQSLGDWVDGREQYQTVREFTGVTLRPCGHEFGFDLWLLITDWSGTRLQRRDRTLIMDDHGRWIPA